jgi:nucleoside-diphosphate-sugar epimerase
VRLLDERELFEVGPGEEAIRASITDVPALEGALRGASAVVHLAGHSSEAPWEDILRTDLLGAYNIFEVCRRQNVGRLVYASSNHAVGCYRRDSLTFAPDYVFPRPDSFYGVGKVAVEALGSFYHDRYGIDVICIRILSCADEPTDLRMLSTWLSPNDAGRLFNAALAVHSPGFRVVWGVSRNTRGWFSLEEASRIGYIPQDDAELYAPFLVSKFGDPRSDDPHLLDVGGGFGGALDSGTTLL